MTHWFAFELPKNLSRTITKQQYKEIHRRLRVYRNLVEAKIDKAELMQKIKELMTYGSTCWTLGMQEQETML